MNDKKQLCFEGLPPKDKAVDIAKKKKRQWEKGFQKWSDEQFQDGRVDYGACGYGGICNYCEDMGQKNPCIKALHAMCKERNISIDYEKQTYEEVWEL